VAIQHYTKRNLTHEEPFHCTNGYMKEKCEKSYSLKNIHVFFFLLCN